MNMIRYFYKNKIRYILHFLRTNKRYLFRKCNIYCTVILYFLYYFMYIFTDKLPGMLVGRERIYFSSSKFHHSINEINL